MTEPEKGQDSPNNSAEEIRENQEDPTVETDQETSQVKDTPEEENLESYPDSTEDETDPYDYDYDDDPKDRELGGRMTFLEHLDELRRRIMYSLISIIVTFVVAWIFREQIYGFLAVPIEAVVEKLVVIRPTEPFTIYLKVSFTAAIFLAAPFLLSQVCLFIEPFLSPSGPTRDRLLRTFSVLQDRQQLSALLAELERGGG